MSTERADSAASSKHHNPEVDGRKQTMGYVFRDRKYNDMQECHLYERLISLKLNLASWHMTCQ